jgi:hypothetical protein
VKPTSFPSCCSDRPVKTTGDKAHRAFFFPPAPAHSPPITYPTARTHPTSQQQQQPLATLPHQTLSSAALARSQQ